MTEQVTEHRPNSQISGATQLLAEAYLEIGELQHALGNSRRIGAAVGILMAHRHLSYEAAFTLLSATSQRLNIKIRDVAEVLLHTGDLPAAS